MGEDHEWDVHGFDGLVAEFFYCVQLLCKYFAMASLFWGSVLIDSRSIVRIYLVIHGLQKIVEFNLVWCLHCRCQMPIKQLCFQTCPKIVVLGCRLVHFVLWIPLLDSKILWELPSPFAYSFTCVHSKALFTRSGLASQENRDPASEVLVVTLIKTFTQESWAVVSHSLMRCYKRCDRGSLWVREFYVY